MQQQPVEVLPEVTAFLQQQHGVMIGGQRLYSDAQLPIYNPANGEVIAQVTNANEREVNQAVENAWQAFQSWSRQRPADRERLLLKLADVLQTHAEELAQLETLNQGKSIHISRAIEVGASIEYTRYMAGWATKIHGETMDISIPMTPEARYTAYTRREPVGVVAGIVPWNFPLMIALWKIIPALACGCTIVLKPSSETPLTALRLAELVLEAGIPPGVVNVITGQGSRAGQALISHPGIRKISFTGSTAVGKQVGHAAVENISRFSLELGGKNPMIVLADADVNQVIEGILTAGLLNQGQVCAAASRFYIQRDRFKEVTEGVAAALQTLRLGPGMDPSAQINPLVSARQQKSVQDYIARGCSQGAQRLTGQAPVDLPGFYVRPTLLTNVGPQNIVMQEEIFGPVLVAVPFDTVEEAIRMANDTPYGLAASIWSNDLRTVMNMIPQIQAGTVWVNSHIPLDPALPFGGYKESGIGREFGRYAIEGFTEIKSVCIAH